MWWSTTMSLRVKGAYQRHIKRRRSVLPAAPRREGKVKRLEIKTFGGLRFTVDASQDVRLPTRKAASLAAYLALHPDKQFSRGTLAELFWGDKEEDRARH